jgi:hypothetical protein
LSDVGNGSKSASSIAGKVSLIAAAVASGVAPLARSVAMRTQSSGSATGWSSPGTTPAAGEHEGALHQKPNEGSGEAEPLQYRRRAQAHLPAKRLLARGDARAALGKLCRQAFFDERVVEIAQRECHL